MDETNLKILKILQQKARIPNVEVSRMISLAPSAVLERIRKMEHQGVIDGYEVRLNPEHFQYAQVSFIHVYAENSLQDESISNALAAIDEIQEVHSIAGEDCYLVKVRTSNIAELNDVIQKRIKVIHGVSSTKTNPVLATHKETARIPIRS